MQSSRDKNDKLSFRKIEKRHVILIIIDDMSARFNLKMMVHCNRQLLIGAFNRNPRSESKYRSTLRSPRHSLNGPIRFQPSQKFNGQTTKTLTVVRSTNESKPRGFYQSI